MHVAGDGNFMHRHNKNAGDCPKIKIDKRIIMPTTFVKSVDGSLDDAGKRPPRSYTSEVAESVLKQCANSHTAGDGSREKTSGDAFDDRGLMVMVCRHDIPLYACNIDTPGEQQMYFIAMLIWLFLHLPDTATVGSWYDINCVTWRMLMAVRYPRHRHRDRRRAIVVVMLTHRSMTSSCRACWSASSMQPRSCTLTRTNGSANSYLTRACFQASGSPTARARRDSGRVYAC